MSTTYIVRVEETKWLVGFFWADTLQEVVRLVDEICDPFSCEYARVASAGIYWGDNIVVPFGEETPELIDLNADEDDVEGLFYELQDKQDAIGFPTFTERLWEQVMGFDEFNWKRFPVTASITHH